MKLIGELWCWLWTSHYYVGIMDRSGWYLRCMHCGRVTNGWLHDTVQPKAMSSKDIIDSISECEAAELELHPGG